MNATETAREDAQWDEIAAWFRARDPAKAAPPGLSARRRARLVWLMERPLFAFLARHHRATASCIAALAVAAVAAALFAVRARRESLLPPVGMALVPPGGDAAPELDPEFEPVDLPGDPPETPSDLLR